MLYQNSNGSDDRSRRESVNIKTIEELGQRTSKGMQSVIDVIPKAQSPDFSALLTLLLEEYSKLIEGVSALAEEHGVKIKDIGTLGRLSSKIGLELSVMTDSSESRAAQVLCESLEEDQTDTVRLIRELENTSCAENIMSLARELASFLETSAERVKSFL